jgi:hypothetical protein
MSLQGGKKRVKRSGERAIVYNVYRFMKTESELGVTIPLSKVQKRVKATGVNTRTLCRILKEGESVESGDAMAFSTPRKQRTKLCNKSILYIFYEAVLRIIVHNFYLTDKERPTVKAIHSKMCESTGYEGGVTSLRLVLKKKWDLGKFNSPIRCALLIPALCQDSLCIVNFSYMLPLNIHAAVLEHFIL